MPLLKPKKPASDPTSFRPVTLTSNLCKLLERTISRRLSDHLESELQPQQFGFRPHRSTTDVLGVIIAALPKLHVDAYLTRWIMDFPDNRTAQVRVNNTFSRTAAFTCGVPQGSVLGPLLFIIVMDSLSAELNKIPDLDHAFFTDDLTLLTASNDKDVNQRTLQHALEVVESCTKTHYMELSAPRQSTRSLEHATGMN